MAWSVKGPIVTAAKKASLPLTAVITTSYAAGDVLFVGIATAGNSVSRSVTDSKGNTYTVNFNPTNPDSQFAWEQLTVALVSGGTIVWGGTSATKAAMAVIGFSVAAGATVSQVFEYDESNKTSIVVATGASTGVERLYLAAHAQQTTINTLYSGDTTNGWALASGAAGTSGAGAGSNEILLYNYQISTSGQRTYTVSSGLWGMSLVVLLETPGVSNTAEWIDYAQSAEVRPRTLILSY